MTVKAKVSFAGIVTMGNGEVKEISDDKIVADLLKAGYVEVIEDETTTKTTGQKTTAKKATKKG